jgi:hypothetical protein
MQWRTLSFRNLIDMPFRTHRGVSPKFRGFFGRGARGKRKTFWSSFSKNPYKGADFSPLRAPWNQR